MILGIIASTFIKFILGTFAKPVLSNFYIDNTNLDRVNFTSSSNVTGMAITGFTITNKIINSVYINTGGLSGYFTVSVAFNFWNNNTIRLGEITDTSHRQSILYNFELQYIDNLINEPTASLQRYVEVSGVGDGLTIGNPANLTYACLNADFGETWNIKQGDYGNSNFVVTNSGNIDAPIIFEGYEVTPGDRPTLPFIDTTPLDSTKMPYINTASTAGIGFSIANKSYVIVRNIQVEGYDGGIANKGSNYTILDNVYGRGSRKCIDGEDYNNGINQRLINSYVSNGTGWGVVMSGRGHLIEDCMSSGNTSVGMDYQFTINGNNIANSGGHIIRGTTAKRFLTDSHVGHGITIYGGGSPSKPNEYSLVENCTVYDTRLSLEARTTGSRYGVWRNIDLIMTASYGSGNSTNMIGIRITSGSYHIFDNIRMLEGEAAISFEQGSTTDSSALDMGHDNIIKNSIFNNLGTSVIKLTDDPEPPKERVPNDNTIVNCTFNNVNYLINRTPSYTNGTGNIIKNCIINNVTTEVGGNSNNFSFEYNNYWNFWGINGTAPSGLGNISVNPNFVDTVYFKPTNDLLISSPREFGVEYDNNSKERASITTIGAVLDANEQISTNTPVLSNFRVNDANKDIVYFDSSGNISGMTTTGFVISGRNITAVDTINKYFTVDSPFNFWDNNTIRLGEIIDTSDSQPSILHNFTLQYITNNILEPTSTIIKYASVLGSGDSSGDSDTNEWTLAEALLNAVQGTTVWVRAGDYGSANFVVSNTGTATAPIKFIGYGIAVGDNPTLPFVPTSAFSSSIMPYINTASTTGLGINLSTNYVMLKHFQVEGYYSTVFLDNGYKVLDNVYARGGYGCIMSDDFHSGNNIRVKDSYVSNATGWGIRCGGAFNMYDNVYSSSNAIVSNDYYINMYGTDVTDSGNSIIRNCNVRRYYNDSHIGHGIHLNGGGETSSGRWQYHTLVEDCTVIDTREALEVRGGTTKYNVFRNINVIEDLDVSNVVAVWLNGGQYNVYENINMDGGESAIALFDSGNDLSAIKGASGNIVRNSTFKGIDYAISSRGSTYRDKDDNKIINCTFSDFSKMFWKDNDVAVGTGNEIINSIINNITTENYNTNIHNFTYNYNDIWNSWTTAIGTNSINENPNFVNTVDYEPTNDLLVSVPSVFGVEYDKNGKERSSTTTIGAISDSSEITVPDIIAPLYISSEVGNINTITLVLTYDENLDTGSIPATTDFIVNDGTVNTVTLVNISGSTIELSLTNVINNGDVIVVSYTKGTNPIQDSSGNESINLTTENVTNNISGAINYSIGNVTYDSKSFDPAAQTGTGLEHFTIAGGYLFCSTLGDIFKYNMVDDLDISLATYTSDTSTKNQGRSFLKWSPDGLTLVRANWLAAFYSSTTSVAYSLINLGSDTITTIIESTDTRGWAINNAGTKAYTIDKTTSIIYQYSISPDFGGTLVYDSKSIDISANMGQCYGLDISPDDKYLIALDNTGDTMKQFSFDINNPDDITFLTYDNIAISVGSQASTPYAVGYNGDGSKILVLDLTSKLIYQYSLNN